MTRVASLIADVSEGFGKQESGVLFGRNGQLFLADGGHHILDYVTGRLSVPNESIDTFWRNIHSRHSYAERHGCAYLHVIFPDKQSILREDFPETVSVCLGDVYLRHNSGVADRARDSIFYPKELLSACRTSPYLVTDTHLTDTATILAATAITQRLPGASLSGPIHDLSEIQMVERHHVGDLGGRFDPKLGAMERFAVPDPTIRLYSNALHRNEGIIDLRINLSSPHPQRILCFGDSFGRSLVRFLAYVFAEVLFMRSRYFHEDIFDLFKPDILITQNVERYMDSCSSDEERPLFFAYPHLTNAPYSPTPEFAEALSAVLSYPRPPYQRFIDRIRSA